MKEFHLCKLHNEAFEVAETRINTECFLPIREGVSRDFRNLYSNNSFPPYTGGCIKEVCRRNFKEVVSSLYGRVYRQRKRKQIVPKSFLPIREGVSSNSLHSAIQKMFPPYTGGCIVEIINCFVLAGVSSLYGRVYRIRPVWSSNWTSFLPVWEGVSFKAITLTGFLGFPPYTGGCIVTNISIKDATCRFLPIREGVSHT